MNSLFKGVLFASGVLLLALGCSKPIVRCPSPGDSPQHHYLAGMELLEEGRLFDAASKFERASFCDEKYGPARAGAALAGALQAKEVSNMEYRKGHRQEGEAHRGNKARRTPG